jgi:membrane protein
MTIDTTGPGGQISRAASRVFGVTGFAIRRFRADASLQAASSLTYTTLLSLVPLLAIAFAVFAAFPAFKGAREQLEIALFTNLVPGIGGEIQGHLTGFLDNAGQLGTVGVVGLGLSAVLLLSTIEATFNRIWRVERPRPLVVRFLLYWGALTLGPLLIGAGITLTTDVFSVARQGLSEAGLDATGFSMEAGGLGDQLWSILLQTLMFTFLFFVIPNRRIRWLDALVGGCVSAVGFQVLKIGFAWYLGNVFTYQAIYGAMAAFPIFLIWLYLSWCVMLLGATFAASVPEWVSRGNGTAGTGGPGATLAMAIRVLAALKRASRQGDEVTGEQLGRSTGTAGLDPVIATMLKHAFIRSTETGGLVLARDLEVATIADLHACLGLATEPVGAVVPDVVSDTATQDVIQGLAKAEREALDIPLSSVIMVAGVTKD